MKGETFAILVCAVISWHAAAQNQVSQGLLELSEDERNETFTQLVQDHHAKCDKVIRTVFSGTTVGLDDWEVLCRDRNSYWLSIPPEPNADIDVLNCRELLAKCLWKGQEVKSRRGAEAQIGREIENLTPADEVIE